MSVSERLIVSRRSLGRALRDARREQGISQVELAERIGIAQPTISAVERGVSNLQFDTLLRLLAALDLELACRVRAGGDPASAWRRA